MIRLKEKYTKEVALKMKDKFGYKSIMAVPRIEKIVVNTGFGKLIAGATTSDQQTKIKESVLEDLSLICGQRPVLTKAKRSVAGFKLREGVVIGAAVTLRGKKAYDFLERLCWIAFPRSRDFRGIDVKSFDKNGSITVGIKEHTIFPEVSPEKVRFIFGFEVSIVTTAKTKEEGIELLKLLGFPIKHGN